MSTMPTVRIPEYAVNGWYPYDDKMREFSLAYAELLREVEGERERHVGGYLFAQSMGDELRRRARFCALAMTLVRRTLDLLDDMGDGDIRHAIGAVFGAGDDFYD